MRVLVTGSAGYIGSHACLKLLEEGFSVVGVDNYSRGNLGATGLLGRFDDFVFVHGDIKDTVLLKDGL